MATGADNAGALVEVANRPALVGELDLDVIGGAELLVCCGSTDASRPALEALSDRGRAVVLALDAPPELGETVVSGVNFDVDRAEEHSGQVLLSPHPAVVALAHLLGPLCNLQLAQSVATIVQPASIGGKRGVDELLNQARAVLAFQPQPQGEVFDRQIVFNLLPTSLPIEWLVHHLNRVVAGGPGLSMQIVQAGIFHCLSVSLFVRFEVDPGIELIHRALERSPLLAFADEPDRLGPIDAAGDHSILVGHVRSDRTYPGSYWLWATMDNLTRGGADNAAEIVNALLS